MKFENKRKKTFINAFLALGCLSVLSCGGGNNPKTQADTLTDSSTTETAAQKNTDKFEPDFNADEFLKTLNTQNEEEVVLYKFIKELYDEENPSEWESIKKKASNSNFASYSYSTFEEMTNEDGEDTYNREHDAETFSYIGCYKMDNGKWLVLKIDNAVGAYLGSSEDSQKQYYFDGEKLVDTDRNFLPEISYEDFNDELLLCGLNQEEKDELKKLIEVDHYYQYSVGKKGISVSTCFDHILLGRLPNHSNVSSYSVEFEWNGKDFVKNNVYYNDQRSIGCVGLDSVFHPEKFKNYQIEKISNGYNVIKNGKKYYTLFTDKQNKIDSIGVFTRQYAGSNELGTKLCDVDNNDYSRYIKQISDTKFEFMPSFSQMTIVDKNDITEKSLNEIKNGMIKNPVFKVDAIITNLKIKHVEPFKETE